MAQEIVLVETDSRGDARYFSMVGSYPIFYLDSEDSVFCPGCALVDGCMSHADINWEDDHLECGECEELIESAYGEPDHDQRVQDERDKRYTLALHSTIEGE